MSDFPDPEEEYELMHADDFELMLENEENNDTNVIRRPAIAKRSLDFTSPAPKKLQNQSKISTEVPKEADIEQFEELPPTPQLPLIDYSQISGSNNKRTVDDLFGDINDLDFEDHPAKKQKTDEEQDLELIDKIIETRKMRQIIQEPISGGCLNTTYIAKENISLDIPRWSFMPITNSDSERLYVRLVPEDAWEESLDVAVQQTSLRNAYASAWDEARKLLETKKEQKETVETDPLPQQQFVDVEQTQLWVDKYKPKSYVELLSDETVNRSVLHWLHLWDKVVFKKEYKPTEPLQRSSFNKRAGQFQMSNKWKGKKETEPELEEDGRPRCKICLLHGPPGVGKTTLAHLLAKLAGYRPVELNASDERSTESFRNALQSATLMRSVLDTERRPNCLILDEIDGAPLPTVELLVRWATHSGTAGSGKKKDGVQPLRRPVIAICNDLYAPALRPLRSICIQIRVQGPTPLRVSARLAQVCEVEHVTTAGGALSALARKAAGDVRAALALLAFASASPTQLTVEDVMNSNVGTKDCSSNMLQALQAIFSKRAPTEGLNSLVRIVSAAGEYDRLIDGIFENYLTSNIDSRMISASHILTNLITYDLVNSWTQRTQNYSLYGMLPLMAASCSGIAAKVKFPTQGQEMYRKRVELESILWSIYSGRSVRAVTSRGALLLDVCPLLPYIVSPKLRTGNVQLCTEREKAALCSAASALCDYSIAYIQQRTPDGLYAFVLQPDVYKLAFYYGTEQRERPPPAVRQAIASQQQLENIRRCEIQAGKITASQEVKSKSEASVSANKEMKQSSKESNLPNHLQRLKPKEIDKSKPTVHKDFFGRVVPVIESSQRIDAVRDLISSSKVFYQYQEGFNNAVRRSVRVRDIL